MRSPESRPTWSDLKRKLTGISRDGLIGLVKDLYPASKDNRVFLHTRFDLAADVLAPYKETISRWLVPDMMTNQQISISSAKRAISDYRRAAGNPEGLAELSVFYCEEGVAFARSCGLDYAEYYSSVDSVFWQALKIIKDLEPGRQTVFRERLEAVCASADGLGWGVYDNMRDMLAKHDAGR